MRRRPALLALAVVALLYGNFASASGLDAARLGVVYNSADPSSLEIARLYAKLRAIPAANIVAVRLPLTDTVAVAEFMAVRAAAVAKLPTAVQSLVLVFSRPYAVGCMSVTTAFAAGYRAAFCEPGCGATETNPLFDSARWLPADTVGWWPSMLLPTHDPDLARRLIQRGVAADATAPRGTLYLVRTPDTARNVRAAAYADAQARLANRISIVQLTAPISHEVPDAMGYFTGVAHVEELRSIHFLPGAVADHLTSSGGVLFGTDQMSALAWLEQGATGTYGAISEPCNHPEKFPNPGIFFDHYARGDTLLEAYWKSVAMPGQGLFIGEPLARPYAADH